MKLTQNSIRKLAAKLTGSLALLAVSAPVYAHTGHGLDTGAHGMLHVEHILTLLAVGVLVAVAFARNRR